MPRSYYNESAEAALKEIESRVEEIAPYSSSVRIRTVRAMDVAGRWVHQLTMIQPVVGEEGPGRAENRRYPNLALLEEWIEPRWLVTFLKELQDNTARVGGETLGLAGDGVVRESEDLPGYNRYSEYPGRLYTTSGRPDHIFNCEHLLAPGLPYYADLSQAINEWTGVPVRIGTADGYIGSVQLFMPECSARIQSLTRQEDVIEVDLELGPTAVEDLHVIGGWREGEHWHRFDELVGRTGPKLQLPVPRAAEQLNIHLIGGLSRWYDFHLEDRRACVGQKRVLDSAGAIRSTSKISKRRSDRGRASALSSKSTSGKRIRKKPSSSR